MATTTRKRNNILIFVFKTEEAGKAFKAYAYEHCHTRQVQFCVHASRVDMKRVLVKGTGSFMFDTNMKSDLLKRAHELGGYLARDIAS